MTVERTSRSETETLQLAACLARRLSAGDVVCLEGPLGSGKTCFVRGLATGLGLDPAEVSSPTFVIWRRYEDLLVRALRSGLRPHKRWGGVAADSVGRDSQTQAALALVHVDAFRLGGPDDLDTVGWEELLEAPDTVIAVEWPSRITAALPPRRITVVMSHVAESTRRLILDAPPGIASTWEGGNV